MKYVILEDQHGRRYPVMFPDQICHDDMAKHFANAIQTGNRVLLKPVTAGFITMHVVSTHDKSETLKLDSDSRDAALINAYDYFHGF